MQDGRGKEGPVLGRRLHTSYLRAETAWSPAVLTAPASL